MQTFCQIINRHFADIVINYKTRKPRPPVYPNHFEEVTHYEQSVLPA